MNKKRTSILPIEWVNWEDLSAEKQDEWLKSCHPSNHDPSAKFAIDRRNGKVLMFGGFVQAFKINSEKS